mgnify:CR=1 FL=1
MTKEDMEDASGGEQECWFGEGGCHELRHGEWELGKKN